MKETISALCSIFNYEQLVNTLEQVNGLTPNEGLWQEKYTILPNISKTHNIIGNIIPQYSGKYWLVFNNSQITDDLQIQLEKNNLWLIDDITIKMFEP